MQSATDAIDGNAVGPIYVFIRSHNRPLYLWPCLDSLFRQTRFPCRFIFIDNASTDPGVRQVVAGFERRKMFHTVHLMDRNEPSNQTMAFFRHRRDMGRYFVLMDSDVVVADSDACWLTEFIHLAESYPRLGVLGSIVDQADFVEPDTVKEILPDLSDSELADLVKADSPERQLSESRERVTQPFFPPGRLLLLRTEIFRESGPPIGTARVCRTALQAGFQHGIATSVRHRHLSFLNAFDYPEYDYGQLREYLRVA